jgi:hypothetical protein
MCEAQCPDNENETPARGLASREESKEEVARVKTGESTQHCAKEDYPCGENGEYVHVCHYSSRDGYQTYCVPESDSAVVAYYPKDYCGKCVGGYSRKSGEAVA